MSSVNQYRIFCNTESKFVTCWSQIPVSTCPNNNTHTVDTETLTIINTIEQSSVVVVPPSTTAGNYRAEGKQMSIEGSTTGTVTMSWPYDIAVISANLLIGPDNEGDIINCYIGANTTIGAIIISAAIGDTILTVSPTVITYLRVGYVVTIVAPDGSAIEDLGDCINIDPITFKITVSNPLTSAFTPGSYIQMTAHNLKNINLGASPTCIKFSAVGSGATYIPKNTVTKVTYQNLGTTPKIFNFIAEYLF